MAEEVRLASRRERHKDARRTRIVDAAASLMREVGVDAVSVKMIAERADVSSATVYNLFGAKGAVMAKVYQRDFQRFLATVSSSSSALDEIFESVRIVADLYRNDRNFYRGMSIRNPSAEPELVASVQEPRLAYWRRLVERAIGQRDLAPDARSDLLSTAMLQLAGGTFGNWCADLITVDELELQTSYGVACLLLGAALPEARAKLEARIASLEAALTKTAVSAVVAG